MNKIFKVIWNPATGSYSVASETAKSRGKKSGRSKLLISALVAGGMLSSFGVQAQAGRDNGQGVNYGQGTGTGWVAIGEDAKANSFTDTGGGSSTAVGYHSTADGRWSTALGAKTHSLGEASVALGINTTSAGERSLAIGASATSTGGFSIALGRYANSVGEFSIAQGDHAETGADDAIAFGRESKALGIMSIALGATANASKEYAMALGASSAASAANAIAVGRNSAAAGVDSLAFGRLSAANAANAIAMGAESKAAENATAVGTNAEANGLNSIALGSGSIADVDNTIALGNQSQAVAAGAIAIGQGNKADGANAIALGNGSITGGVNAIALGQGSYAGLENGTAIGAQASAQGKNSVALGAGSVATDADTVSVGNTTAQRQIVNMAAGDISTTSTDAINGSQLYAISKSVADNLGGGATVNAQGVVTSPNYRLKSGIFGTVGDALTGLDNNTLQWDSLKKAYSAAHGTDTTSTITNVKDGAISDTSKDAVNGSQLKTTNDNVATNTANITTNTNSINTLTDSVGDLKDDALLWNGTAFSAAHGTEATSKITNVKDGDLTAGSTDAVNGSQLKTTNDNVATNTTNITNLTDSVGDLKDDALLWNGTAFSAAHGTDATSKITNVKDGDLTAGSTDAVNGSQLKTTNDAVAANTTNIATNTTNITNLTDAVDSLGDDSLLWNATAGAFSAAHGTDATSKITNVKDGDLTAGSTDAVNGSQLKTTNDAVAANTTNIATNTTNITNLTDAVDSLGDDSLLWNATAGAFSAAHGTEATSKITNVKDGDLTAGSTDAVNGSQLFNTNMLIQQNSEIINQLAGNTSETYIEDNGAGINYVRTNDNGLAFNDASASGIGATAVGYNAVASGESSVAIGQGSYSNVDTGIALGSSSVSSRVIVKGSRDTSVSEEGVVIGYDTTDGELLGALSIGDDGKYRQIINVADGSEAHDAVTVRQLQNAIGAVATTPTKYFHANSTEEDSLAVGEDSLAMGAKTIVNGNVGIGIGYGAYVDANALNGIAIGSNARANHANSIAMGSGSQTTRGAQTGYTAYNMDAPQNSVGEFSVGSEDGQRQITNVAAGSADTDAVNVGQLKVTDAQVSQNTQSITNLNNQVTNLDTRVTNIENGIGDIVTTGSTKYFKTNTDGVDANAQGKDSVAIGSGSIAAADNSVALGTGSVANEENTISVGSSTNQRRITNVAAGVNATDAVNVSQLKSSEAGGVRYDTKADGSVDYSNITLGGGNGGTTRISNVSAGVNNNDAVNYAQLKQSVQETKQYTDQRMVEMDNKLSKTESKLSGGIASAMAMTGLPQAYTPGASMASIGGGTYNGESAVALGVSMVSANGRWVYKLQGSTNSQGEYSAALGAGIQW
ncbi:adhesin [Escherichia coli]|nr:adhesin [Escherichia coli]